ncbi:MAG: acetyl/propionyl-CoA carboxylase subunit alpha, partial [Novosphingobium sp.]|nr:acetyl/propionyl-CoA carboxylase subunit alpha [Novosphingobium sp.]
IMQHPRFREGELTTGFIAEEYPEGFSGASTSPEFKKKLAAIAGFIATARTDRARRVDGQLAESLDPPSAWSVKLDGTFYAVELTEQGVTVDREAVDIAMEYAPGDRLVLAEVDGEDFGIKVETTRTGLKMTTRGAIHQIQVLPAHIAHLAEHMIEKIPP